MAFGNVLRSLDGVPIAQVYVPGVGFVALQGGTLSTDGSGNTSAIAPMQLTDGSGFISSALIAAIRYLKTAMVQDIEVSATNSSVVNLASGASFTGTTVTTTGISAIQVCLFADQNCTIQVQQAQEDPGTNWNIIDTWTYTASSNAQDATRTIQAMGLSTRVIVTNNGGSTTTAFRLLTALCPLAEVLPRNLTQLGNLKVTPQELSVDSTILASAARTTTQTSADFTNTASRGVKVVLDMTVVGTGNVTLTIQGKDIASGKYYTLLAGAAVVTNVTNTYTVFPGAAALANVVANETLPHTWRVLVTANNANSATYSIGASTLP